MTQQYELTLPSYPRGFHLITEEVMRAVTHWPEAGVLHVFIQHTSAGLTLNENADPTVRTDFAAVFDRLVKENEPYYEHTFEGPDDMPAHIKSTLCGSAVSMPITNGRPNLGTWQGIYLCEFRNRGGGRKLIITITS